jgi:hypothetical protein
VGRSPDIIADEIKRIKDKYGSTYAILALSDGHQETKSVHGMHATITELLIHLGGSTWAVRNPDSWEGGGGVQSTCGYGA